METFSVRKTTAQFIAEASIIHGSQYDYSKVDYKTNKEKVCIICPKHGEFWQRPQDHIQKKLGVHVALNSNLSNENGINIYTDYGKES